MTSEQLSEWEAMDRLDPIGSWRDDYRMSYLAALITNLAIRINGKKGAKLSEVKDFMLDWGKEPGEIMKQSTDEMKNLLLSFAKSQNKRIKPKKEKP